MKYKFITFKIQINSFNRASHGDNTLVINKKKTSNSQLTTSCRISSKLVLLASNIVQYLVSH